MKKNAQNLIAVWATLPITQTFTEIEFTAVFYTKELRKQQFNFFIVS